MAIKNSPTNPNPLVVASTSRRPYEDSASLRHRPPRWSTTSAEPPIPGIRRRGSNLSELSKEARETIRTSTDDLLSPRLRDGESNRNASHWDSAPLAFALLPAIGGLLFKNGSSVITDIMLLGLAAVFLNWSVRMPWDWYHSAQSTRKADEYDYQTLVDESEDDAALSVSQAKLDEVHGEVDDVSPAPSQVPKPLRPNHARKKAVSELYTHEFLALVACFLFPALGAYLLHTLRSQLTRPSEGLVSNYNLTIFLLASEIRPLAHLVKLIRSRTLHLQRVVRSSFPATSDTQDFLNRLTIIEARVTGSPPSIQNSKVSEPILSHREVQVLTAEVRKTFQPELDALNRAVRRYEKRATLQTFQTESRLADLEGRLSDAISLAAAAANGSLSGKGVGSKLGEWAVSVLLMPWRLGSWGLGMVVNWLAGLATTATAMVFSRPEMPPSIKTSKVNARRVINGRVVERGGRALR